MKELMSLLEFVGTMREQRTRRTPSQRATFLAALAEDHDYRMREVIAKAGQLYITQATGGPMRRRCPT